MSRLFSEKRLYRIRWPDGNVELIAAENDEELLLLLDEESPLFDAEIEEVELTVPIRIDLRKRLRTVTEFMKLPAKRRLLAAELNRILSDTYDAETPIRFH